MPYSEEAGKVASQAIDSFKASPGLLFLTLVNVGFLIFCYFLGGLVLNAYNVQQEQIHQRYQHTLDLVDRCTMAVLQRYAKEGATDLSKPLRPDLTQRGSQ